MTSLLGNAQKIMKTIGDAKRLEIKKEKFIGKPLKILLNQIGSKIKSAIGNPDDISKRRTKIITLYFVDKNEILNNERKGKKLTSISVILEPAKERKQPLSASSPWTGVQEKEYGDMIIIRFWVNDGSNPNKI